MNYTKQERARNAKTTRRRDDVSLWGTEDFVIKGVLCVGECADKINDDKTNSWTMITTTMQARQTDAGCEVRTEGGGYLIIVRARAMRVQAKERRNHRA